MDSSKWTQYSAPDAELQAILTSSPPIPSFADFGTASQLRSTILAHFTSLIQNGTIVPVSWSAAQKSEFTIPARDGADLRAIVYKPESRPEEGPLLVYFHGGGWTFGYPEAGEAYFEPLVKERGCTVVSLGYRVAPEEKWPRAVEDAWDAVKWCAANASDLGADLSKGFLVSGSSAGGNLAAVVAHQAVDEALEPAVSGVVLMAPVLVHPDAVPEEWRAHYKSWEEHKDGVVLDRRGLEWFAEQYQPDVKSPLASPLLWKTHKGQPKTYMQVFGADPLRDEALIYEHILKEEGVPTKLDIFSGIPHAGPDFFPMHSCAKKAVSDMQKGVEWILSNQ